MKEGGVRILSGVEHQPLISIITVTYNAAHLLPEYLNNVLPYVNAEVELVILDGNSTDGSIDILAQHNSKITYWRSESDQGIYDAMNKAISYAKGGWLYFMGADDRLLGGFGKMGRHLTQPATVYYAKVVFWGEIAGGALKKYDLTKIDICHQSIFYPRRVFDKYKYETRYPVYADQHLNLSLFGDRKFQWKFVDELVAIYDTRGFSAGSKDPEFDKHYDQMVKQHLGLWVYARHLFRVMKKGRRQRN
ncbi:glycosyltransferase [Mucilaginibacter sp. RS28]|uniref:Glycosyltransferase n=1 Tax=Mucilaginibacter straminoryzae TaxID=2932774 RepID=A0A9X1WZC9_9SPHI|nr:glycosyltransferase [Mucilaginibacter straminoryzae]MCJ8208432.1 glycosyltransferase [Mucilaginibacter straminoryzae]